MNEQKKDNKAFDYTGIYQELYGVTKTTLGMNIDNDRIHKVIDSVVHVFMKDLYNPLLQYFYLSSEENYLLSHITNNVILAVAFGASVNLSEENLHGLGLCAFCHDFGMREYTHLFQKNKRLSVQENRMIQDHPMKSAEMFKDYFPDEVISSILDVHEQVDGRGPKRKRGSEINLLARMTAICDVYEALTHSRNSRKRIVPYDAMKLIIKQKDKIFDEKGVKRFLDFIAIYPVGSLVYLNTGEIGIVIAGNYGHPTRSVVRVLLTTNQEVDQTGKYFDLLKDTMVYVSGCVPLAEEEEMLRVLKPRGTIEPHIYY